MEVVIRQHERQCGVTAAGIFADLVLREDAVTQASSVVCYCLSEAVAESLTPFGFAVRVAALPREEDVHALLDSEAASS